MNWLKGLCAAVPIALLAGCVSSSSTAPTTQPTVASTDFDQLFAASARVAEDLKFTVDREDRRAGQITTVPMTSAQWFEPWRSEVRTTDDLAESSVASIRRTLVIDISPREGVAGQKAYVATPRVVVERQALAENRISNAAGYRAIYRRPTQTGTRETDQGLQLPRSYWYATGTDAALEQLVAQKIADRVRK
ncbi:MAG: hypothetical protein QM770_17985 [Tepidisphaeraceae bacterium]